MKLKRIKEIIKENDVAKTETTILGGGYFKIKVDCSCVENAQIVEMFIKCEVPALVIRTYKTLFIQVQEA